MGNDLLTGFLAGQGDGNDRGGFFGNEGLWAVIILAIIFGWGRNGFAGNGGDGGSMTSALPYILAGQNGYGVSADIQRGFDTSGLSNQITSVANGICSLGYDQLAQINGVNANISAGFANLARDNCTSTNAIVSSVNAASNNLERGQNALQAQIASCCCETQRQMERGFCDIGYQMATDTCALNTNAANNTRDIIDAMNCGFRGIEAKLNAQEMAAKDAQIAAQNQKIFSLELAASQCAQNNYIVNQLRPAPVPAFNVPLPWNYGGCGNGCGNGCGCNY